MRGSLSAFQALGERLGRVSVSALLAAIAAMLSFAVLGATGAGSLAPEMAQTQDSRRRLPRSVVVAGLALIAAIAGYVWLQGDRGAVSTDDAYVRGDEVVVSPKVRGMIETVTARPDSAVRSGDPLVRIDPEEYEARVAGAKGDLLAARAAERAALAGLARLDAEEALAKSQVSAAESAAGGQGARDPGLRSAFVTARAQALVAARSRGEIEASLAEARASAFRAQAALDFAARDLANTTVRAPADGAVGDLTAEVGAFVQPGVSLMVLVRPRSAYVLANLKETQIGAVHLGQKARVQIDALGRRSFSGRVVGLAPGSGSEFSLIPFEPGAGNFTKIVQRVGVRIALDPGQAMLDQLRPGLSARVTVTTAPPR